MERIFIHNRYKDYSVDVFVSYFYRKYGIEVRDFGPSWRDGHAFNAMIHNIQPDLVDLSALPNNPNRVNLERAFSAAENTLGIPRLLDPEGKTLVTLTMKVTCYKCP